MIRIRERATSVILSVLLTVPAFAGGADAATRYVKKSGSDWGGSVCSNAAPCATISYAATVADAGDTIQVGAGTFLEPGVLVDKDLTITGAGSRHGTHVTITNTGSVFRVLEGVTASIAHMRIQGGKATDGGGIHNRGVLTVTSVLLYKNTAAGYGGAIYNNGQLTLAGVSILMNSAGLGGGLFTGLDAAEALVADSRILWNTATSNHNVLGPVAGIAHGSGSGHLIIVRSAVAWNAGVGIATLAGGPLLVQDSTISTNDHTGLRLQGTPATLTNVTVAGNKSYGLDVRATELEVRNSIVATNTPQGWNHGPQCHLQTANVLTDHSIFGDLSCNPGGLDWGASLVDADPHLTPLAYHGGPSPVHRLLSGSPAIDSANPSLCWAWDQQGRPRPVDGDGDGLARCDMGAHEAKATGRPMVPDTRRR